MRDPILNIAVKAACAAGNIITRAFDRPEAIEISEKNPHDFVTNIDKKAEQEIIYLVRKAYPKHAILGEESGELSGKDYTWIIDPLDGTRNFIHGFPHFGVSIGIMYRDKIEHAVIYDPIRQDLFTATRGKGARLNDKRIRVGQQSQLENALLGTGFVYTQSAELLRAHLDTIGNLIPHCGDIRRAGSASLDLAYIACGRLDGFWESNLKIWDIAAGVLLITEAGGLVSDLNGGNDYLKTGNIAAGNPNMLKLLLKNIVK